ncbi:hypothetical protein PO909_032857 [Leuciscus waleckii]
MLRVQVVLLLALVSAGAVDLGSAPAGFYPRFNPFFFLCTHHHGELEGPSGADGGAEVLLTFQIHGSPAAYVPGQEYQGEYRTTHASALCTSPIKRGNTLLYSVLVTSVTCSYYSNNSKLCIITCNKNQLNQQPYMLLNNITQ